MLVKFKVGNFASFGRIQEFSMVAGSNGPESMRTFDDQYPTVLRTSFLYGQNSAGKSSFIKAMIYSRGQIIGIDPTNPLISSDFKYRIGGDYSHRNKDGLSEKKESYFEYYLTTDYGLFSYGFEIITEIGAVVSEWLIHISDDGSEEIIFEREGQSVNYYDEKINLDAPSELLIHAVYKNNIAVCKDDVIRSIYLWFKDCLIIRTNDSTMAGLIISKKVISDVNDIICTYDTGVVRLKETDLRPGAEKRVNEDINLKNISFNNHQGDDLCLTVLDKRLIITKKDEDKYHSEELMLEHESSQFNMMYRDESDGTKRLLLFLFLFNNNTMVNTGTSKITRRTIVIDEIDRSMHTQMTHKILEDYIKSPCMSQSQLIATTHECDVLPELRPDEVWFVDKSNEGESTLYSLEEYSMSSTNGLDELYLEGRFGAIPKTRPINRGVL